jgi:hypothetical protein
LAAQIRAHGGTSRSVGVLKRYLYAYGPSTPQLFAQWLSASPRWSTELFDSLRDELEEIEVEGVRAWVAKEDTTFPTDPARGVRLLPYFDAYAYPVGNPRARLYPNSAERSERGNYQTLLVDGVIAGRWQQSRSARQLDMTAEPFQALTPPQHHELEAQVQRLGAFLDSEARLIIGPVTVGSHA